MLTIGVNYACVFILKRNEQIETSIIKYEKKIDVQHFLTLNNSTQTNECINSNETNKKKYVYKKRKEKIQS